MSWYTPEQKRESVARAHAILAETAPAVERTVARSAGSPLVYKTHERREDDSLPAEYTSSARSAPAKSSSEKPWWEWVEECIYRRLKAFAEEAAKGMAEFVGRKLDPLERELKLLRHEFIVLREDVALARALHDLRSEVAEARKQVPKVPAIESRLRAEATVARVDIQKLQRELDVTKDKLGKLRVDQSITDYNLREMRNETVATKATASIEMETSSSRFVMRNIDPGAAKALREFASGVIDAQDGGAVWGRIEGTA